MAEVIVRYDTQVRGRDGRRYEVQASGRGRPDGLWEGWLEFLPVDGGKPVVSDRETTQPNRNDLEYWASGLTSTYLDGALHRALTEVEVVPPAAPEASPVSSAPERHPKHADTGAVPEAVLDPFHVYAEGDEILRGQLRALSPTHLRNIVRAYQLSELDAGALERLDEPSLVTLIMAAVERSTRL